MYEDMIVKDNPSSTEGENTTANVHAELLHSCALIFLKENHARSALHDLSCIASFVYPVKSRMTDDIMVV